MPSRKYVVEIEYPDGDYITPAYNIDIQEMIDGDLNQDCPNRFKIKVEEVIDYETLQEECPR